MSLAVAVTVPTHTSLARCTSGMTATAMTSLERLSRSSTARTSFEGGSVTHMRSTAPLSCFVIMRLLRQDDEAEARGTFPMDGCRDGAPQDALDGIEVPANR